jgi:plastocyanin
MIVSMRLIVAFPASLIALLWLVGCDRALLPAPQAFAASQPAAPSVAIDNFSFNPATITVPAGTTVTWVNHDDVPHTVTANDKAFTSKAMDTDDRFTHQFTQPGTYPYFCAVHTHMTGTVIVK